MKNLGQLMKQAQEMQSKVQEMQERLAQLEVTGMSGGGMVEVVLTGKGEARKVSIDRVLVDPAEVEVLEDLLVAAINDARAKADAQSAEEMQKLTGGISLPPGFKLPF
jgi:DNA-binding YbaB/EbfC family protein